MPAASRVDAFRGFARQIEAANVGNGWRAAEQVSANAVVFTGGAGESIVFNAAGQVFRGNIGNAGQFTIGAGGVVTAHFDKLTMLIK
jgi:hypothetical protein